MAQHQKHENQMRDLQLQCEANVRELHQLQVRRRAEDKAPGGDARGAASGRRAGHRMKWHMIQENAANEIIVFFRDAKVVIAPEHVNRKLLTVLMVLGF